MLELSSKTLKKLWRRVGWTDYSLSNRTKGRGHSALPFYTWEWGAACSESECVQDSRPRPAGNEEEKKQNLEKDRGKKNRERMKLKRVCLVQWIHIMLKQ